MSAGIYLNNGVYAYAMDLEKKLRRRKNAVIIEEYQGDLQGKDLERELQNLVDKYNGNKPVSEKVEGALDSNIKKYYWRNNKTGHTITSIYPHINNIPNINPLDWEQY